MIIYDITSVDLAIKTIVELTNISEDRIRNFITSKITRSEIGLDISEVSAKNLIEEFQINFSSIDLNELSIIGLHYTSNNDNCNSVFSEGIHNLKYVLTHKTPLNMFLKQNGIVIDIACQTLKFKEKEYDIGYDKNKYTHGFNQILSSISMKTFEDNKINCFLFVYDINRYLGEVDKQPEILSALDAFLPEIHLKQKWSEISDGYVIRFNAKFSDFEIDYELKDKFQVLTYLLDCALEVSSDFYYNEIPQCLKIDRVISKDMMTSIQKLT